MRIITGKYKGALLLHIPKNKNIRPLKDMVRESIFNLLEHSNKILFKVKHSKVLDLYSGTGSFGLECISRYAEKVYFVEKDNSAIQILKKNIEKLKIKNKTKILQHDVLDLYKFKEIQNKSFDLIFCDPPFKDKNMEELIYHIQNNNLLKKEGILIIHRNKSTFDVFPNTLKTVEKRSYGLSQIIFAKLL